MSVARFVAAISAGMATAPDRDVFGWRARSISIANRRFSPFLRVVARSVAGFVATVVVLSVAGFVAWFVVSYGRTGCAGDGPINIVVKLGLRRHARLDAERV